MKLAIIILERIELLEDLLSAFLEIGIEDANVLDSSAMGHIISENIPIFAGLMDAFAGSSPIRKTIIFPVSNEMKEKVIEVSKDICSDIEEEKSGTLCFLPLEDIIVLG